MKFILLTLLLAVTNFGNITSANVSSPATFSTQTIHQLFVMLRNLIRKGSEENGVPVMDPYVGDLAVNFSEEYFRLEANITKARLTGLSDFFLLKSDFDVNEISIDTKIMYPLLKIYSDSYNMKGEIWPAIPLKGQGIFEVEIRFLSLTGKFYLKPSEDGKSILIDKVENLKFDIQKIVSTTQYDNNFDDIFNAMIGDLLAGYLTRFSGYLSSLYSQDAVDLVNPMLDKFDTWQIIATILQN